MPMTIRDANAVGTLLQHLAGQRLSSRERLDEVIVTLSTAVGSALGAGQLTDQERLVAAATLEHVRGDVFGTSPIPVFTAGPTACECGHDGGRHDPDTGHCDRPGCLCINPAMVETGDVASAG